MKIYHLCAREIAHLEIMPGDRIKTMRSICLIAFLKESECGLMLFMISDKYFAL